MTPQKICFRYDGSDEAKEAHKIWDNIKPPQTNSPAVNFFYYSSGVAYNWDESKPSNYTLVPPAEFIRMMKGEEWKPKYGEEVEVSDGRDRWIKRKFLCFTSRNKPVVEVPEGGAVHYEHIRPIRKSLREELLGLLQSYATPKPELTDRIIQLIKERGVEG